MKMVAHQTVGMNLPSCSATSASQQLEKERSIFVVLDDGLPPIASTEQMIDGTRYSILRGRVTAQQHEDLSDLCRFWALRTVAVGSRVVAGTRIGRSNLC